MFVHLAPESRIKAIQRGGINRLRKLAFADTGGVFAMPVTRNFYISHQWLRELKRRCHGVIAGVYFRIPDDEIVWVGHYNQNHRPMTAAQATALMMTSENREGYQVIILRRINTKEIHRIRALPQVVGWRYYPGSHGRRPCGCSFCQFGQYGARRLRKKYGQNRLRPLV